LNATAIVRVLQQQYGFDPVKYAASGPGEYKRIADNRSPEIKAVIGLQESISCHPDQFLNYPKQK